MKQYLGTKYRLLPNEQQLQLIKQFCGCTRVVYNSILGKTQKQLENKELIAIPKVTELYEEHPFLKEVDSLALANARLQINKALTNFFKPKNGKRKGKKLGFPKFKKKNISKDSYTSNNVLTKCKNNYTYNSIYIKDNYIRLPKIGFVKFKQHRPLQGLIKSVTVTINKDNSVEISVLCEININKKTKQISNPKDLKILGLDMSMNDFFVSSNGEKPNFQREYRKSEKKRRRLSKSLSRKKLFPTGEKKFSKKWDKDIDVVKPSKNREKIRIKLTKLEHHVSNKRKDYCHKLSRKLVDTNDVIVLEDINLQGMAGALKLGKSVNDLGFGMFRTFLEYKSLLTDTLVVKVPRFFASSKTCNDCGYKYSELKLSEREWTCPDCGTIHDRDLNAAYNLRDYFVKSLNNTLNTAGTAELKACGDEVTTLRETLMQILSLKQEGNTVKFADEAPSFLIV